MDLKFFLNKFVKADNIENYTLKSLFKLKDRYNEFLDNSDGFDPDFPMSNFRDKASGEKISGKNIHTLSDEEREEVIENFKDSSGKVRPQRPQASQDEYVDKREKSSDEERALKFLKSHNLR